MIFLIAQLYFLWYLFRYGSNTKFYKFIKSGVFVISMLVLGFIGSFLLGMGIFGSWSRWFLVVVGLLTVSNLWIIVLERIKVMITTKRVTIRNFSFILNHFGLLLFLVGGIYGIWGRKDFKVALPANNLSWEGEFIKGNEQEKRIIGELSSNVDPYFVSVGKDLVGLKRFEIESRGGGIGSYKATVFINDKLNDVKVNNPIKLRFGEKLYLSGYNLKQGSTDIDNVVVMYVKEKWEVVIKTGVIMLLFGALGLLFIKD